MPSMVLSLRTTATFPPPDTSIRYSSGMYRLFLFMSRTLSGTAGCGNNTDQGAAANTTDPLYDCGRASQPNSTAACCLPLSFAWRCTLYHHALRNTKRLFRVLLASISHVLCWRSPLKTIPHPDPGVCSRDVSRARFFSNCAPCARLVSLIVEKSGNVFVCEGSSLFIRSVS